jgi:hypothetical protein
LADHEQEKGWSRAPFGASPPRLVSAPQNPEAIADELNSLGLIGADHFWLVFRIVVNQVQRSPLHALHPLYPDAIALAHHIPAVNITRPAINDRPDDSRRVN